MTPLPKQEWPRLTAQGSLSLPGKSIGGIAAALAVIGLLSAGGMTARAEEAPARPAAEPVQLACPSLRLGPAVPPSPDRSRSPILIYAKELSAGKTEQGEARGNVELFRADQPLFTERVLYNPVTEVVTVPGAVDYRDQQVWFKGQEAQYSFLEESGWFAGID